MRHAPHRESNRCCAQNSQSHEDSNHNQNDLQCAPRLCWRWRYRTRITWRRRGRCVTWRRSARGNRGVRGRGIRGNSRGGHHRGAAVCAKLLVGWDFCPALSTVDSHAHLLVFQYTSGVFPDVLPATCQYTSRRARQARLLISFHPNGLAAPKPSQRVRSRTQQPLLDETRIVASFLFL